MQHQEMICLSAMALQRYRYVLLYLHRFSAPQLCSFHLTIDFQICQRYGNRTVCQNPRSADHSEGLHSRKLRKIHLPLMKPRMNFALFWHRLVCCFLLFRFRANLAQILRTRYSSLKSPCLMQPVHWYTPVLIEFMCTYPAENFLVLRAAIFAMIPTIQAMSAAASTASETAESALPDAVLDPQPHSTDAHRSNKDSLFHDSSSLLIILRMECQRFSLFSEKMCKTIQVQFSELFNPSFPAGIRRHSVFLPPLPPR